MHIENLSGDITHPTPQNRRELGDDLADVLERLPPPAADLLKTTR